MKLPKSLRFGHRLTKAEPKVVQARAIGVKDDECTFCIVVFYEIAEGLEIWPPFIRSKKTEQNCFLVLFRLLLLLQRIMHPDADHLMVLFLLINRLYRLLHRIMKRVSPAGIE
jgi:hypothetical protein